MVWLAAPGGPSQTSSASGLTNGLEIPKVKVDRWKTALVTLQGKRCSIEGTKHLPGTLQRSYQDGAFPDSFSRSFSDGVLTGPHAGNETQQFLKHQITSRHLRNAERQRKDIRQNPSQAPWHGQEPSFIPSPPKTPSGVNRPSSRAGADRPPSRGGDQRPCTPAKAGFDQADAQGEMKLEVPLGKGGFTHGSKIMELDRIGYDPTKHGWQHPKGRAHQALLQATEPHQHASWEWDIRKAKDHIGFPARDVRRGHVIKTAVSSAGPDWFLSVGMDRVPKGGNRLPCCEIYGSADPTAQDSRLCLKQRIFEKGPNLSVRERQNKSKRPTTATSIPGSVRSISVPIELPKQGDRPSSAPTGSLFNTAPGQTSVTFDDWRGTYDQHIRRGERCKHDRLYCDFHPCHSHQGWRVKSDLMAGSAVAKQKRAPVSEYVGVDARYPGPLHPHEVRN